MAAVKLEEISFLGYWKMTEMQAWDQDSVNLVVPGFIEFDEADGEHITGGFQFGTVSGVRARR